MTNLYNRHKMRRVVDDVNNAVIALPNPKLIACRELLGPSGTRVSRKPTDPLHHAGESFAWNLSQLFFGGTLDDDFNGGVRPISTKLIT